VLDVLATLAPTDAAAAEPSAVPSATPRSPSTISSLTKGANVSLSKQAPGLRSVSVGLGWDVRTTAGIEFDLDASAIATGSDNRVLSDTYFVFFNNLRSPDGAIVHTGDNLTGAGDGDDEVIEIDLTTITNAVSSIFFPVSIYDANARGQSFGQVRDAFIRVVDRSTDRELARYDLTEDASTETAMVFGELYRRGDEWKFRAIGQGYANGLAGIARDYGVDVG
jgi:tellurium resistance protein TerD